MDSAILGGDGLPSSVRRARELQAHQMELRESLRRHQDRVRPIECLLAIVPTSFAFDAPFVGQFCPWLAKLVAAVKVAGCEENVTTMLPRSSAGGGATLRDQLAIDLLRAALSPAADIPALVSQWPDSPRWWLSFGEDFFLEGLFGQFEPSDNESAPGLPGSDDEKTETSQAGDANGRTETLRAVATFGPQEKALAILARHPEWTDTRIAEEAGIARTTLYTWPAFKMARAALKSGRSNSPRGYRDRHTGRIEAEDGD